MGTHVRAVRGAISCDVDSPSAISEATRELLSAMLIKNDLVVEDVISVLFTATPDLTSAFPAKFAREIGFGVVPLMCASEIAVPGAMSRVIRIMMHVESTVALNQVQHVYLRDAVALRDDLAR